MTFGEMTVKLEMVVRPNGCTRVWQDSGHELEVFIQGHGQCRTTEDNSWRVHFTGTQFTSFEMDFYTVDTMYNFIKMMERAWEEAVAFIEQE